MADGDGADGQDEPVGCIPVYMRVGGGEERQIGSVTTPGSMPVLLRAVADSIESDPAAGTSQPITE